jgi:penicillin-binding protein 2
VLDVSDFSILAAATYPTYDLSQYVSDSDYYTELLEDSTNPLFNRAFNGAFTPGSVYKPCVAAAALEEGVLTSSTKITCNHTYEYYAPSYTPTCLGYHGALTVTSALAYSCNIFFYDTGRQLGIENMDLYSKSFGLGTTTGVEIGESEGTLASPSYRISNGGTWQPGDVIQAAIGQSDNAFTPLQLATYCATIANNGTRLKTHLVDKITDYTRDTVLSQTEAEEVETVSVSAENLKIVQEGMREVCTIGTASSTFGDYGIAVAGKTGTAENPGHSDNTVFIGYAPYDNPQIAVAVVIEYGTSGVYSTGVAKDIFDAYFYGKVLDEDGNLVTPGIDNAADSIETGANAIT